MRSRRAIGMAAAACAACALVGAPGPWQVGVVLVMVVVAGRVVVSAVAQRRLASALRQISAAGSIAGIPVQLAPATGVVAVAGLWRPAIFCDPAALAPLTDAERRAVVLHEVGHRRRRDPARLLVLSVVAPLLGRTTAGHAWLERQRAHLEIAADRYALGAGGDRGALASALLRLGQSGQPAQAVAFASAVDLRLAALLDDRPVPRRGAGWLLGIAIAVVGVCTVMLPVHVHGLVEGVACVVGWCHT